MIDPTELIAAFEAWDRWGSQVTQAAATAIANGDRPPRLTAKAGAAVTGHLVDVEVVTAQTIGISSRRLHMRIINGRQAGLTITEAIHRALDPDDA